MSIAKDFPNCSVVESERVTGASESRFALANRIRTEFVFFSDDDVYADPGSISYLVNTITQHDDIDILSGVIRNRSGKYFDVSQRLAKGYLDRDKTICKTFYSRSDLEELGIDIIESDIPGCQSIMRSAIFRRVNWDPNYTWFFEWYDFGMQCARNKVRLYGTHKATFLHDPGGYTIETNRRKNREIDRQRFMTKWGVRQLGPTGGGYR